MLQTTTTCGNTCALKARYIKLYSMGFVALLWKPRVSDPVRKLVEPHFFHMRWRWGAVETGCSDLYDIYIYIYIYTSLLYSTTPIHCTPLPLHPAVMNTQCCLLGLLAQRSLARIDPKPSAPSSARGRAATAAPEWEKWEVLLGIRLLPGK